MPTTRKDEHTFDHPFAATVTVNEMTREFPATIAAFNEFGIDTCCGGALPITEAAQRHGAALPVLLKALADAVAADDQ